jgi:uncharacterized membrane protein YeaQ/YmgE (transglycosylase-associated protein family)
MCSTTYLTGTLTAVVAELVTRDRRPGLVRSIGVLTAIVAGAVLGGLAAGHAPGWLPAAILTPLAAVIIISVAKPPSARGRLSPRRDRLPPAPAAAGRHWARWWWRAPRWWRARWSGRARPGG